MRKSRFIGMLAFILSAGSLIISCKNPAGGETPAPEPPVVYTITYFGNGQESGTPPAEAGTYEAGESVTLKSNSGSLARTGYTFSGWNEKEDASGELTYQPGDALIMPAANVTLYAVWDLIESDPAAEVYTITYAGNGNDSGTPPKDTASYESGATVTLKSNSGSLALTGYSFGGWNEKEDGSGSVTYQPGDTFTMSAANVNLYAVWAPVVTPPLPKVYTVTYHGNGNTSGEAPEDLNTYAEKSSVTVKGNSGSLARTGYSFGGWNDQEDGTGTVTYQAGDTFTMSAGDYNLYAVWIPLTGGIGVTSPASLSIQITGPSSISYGNAASFTGTITGGTADTRYWYLDGELVSGNTTLSYTTPSNLDYGPHTVTLYAKKGASLFSASKQFTVE